MPLHGLYFGSCWNCSLVIFKSRGRVGLVLRRICCFWLLQSPWDAYILVHFLLAKCLFKEKVFVYVSFWALRSSCWYCFSARSWVLHGRLLHDSTFKRDHELRQEDSREGPILLSCNNWNCTKTLLTLPRLCLLKVATALALSHWGTNLEHRDPLGLCSNHSSKVHLR